METTQAPTRAALSAIGNNTVDLGLLRRGSGGGGVCKSNTTLFETSAQAHNTNKNRNRKQQHALTYQTLPPPHSESWIRLDKPPAHLVCAICRDIFTHPVETPCGHTFCRDCITRWVAQEHEQPCCPVDRARVTATQLRPAGPIVQACVDAVLVKCSFCDHSCTQGQTLGHFPDQCRSAQAREMRVFLRRQQAKELQHRQKQQQQQQQQQYKAASDMKPPNILAVAAGTGAESGAGQLPGLVYEYYEGTFEELPEDFSTLRPHECGLVATPSLAALDSLGVLKRPTSAVDGTSGGAADALCTHRDFALRFSGYLEVASDAAGRYRFATESNDGSRLSVDGTLVVDNGGQHYAQRRTGEISLEPGPHRLSLTYFHKNGKMWEGATHRGPVLRVTYAYLGGGGDSSTGSTGGNKGKKGSNKDSNSNSSSSSSTSSGSSSSSSSSSMFGFGALAGVLTGGARAQKEQEFPPELLWARAKEQDVALDRVLMQTGPEGHMLRRLKRERDEANQKVEEQAKAAHDTACELERVRARLGASNEKAKAAAAEATTQTRALAEARKEAFAAKARAEGLEVNLLERAEELEHMRSQLHDMRACCFNGVALAIKMQLGPDEVAAQAPSNADMFERAEIEGISQQEWAAFVLTSLTSTPLA